MKIYAISDDCLTPHNKLPNMLELAIIGGCEVFQFRDKKSSDNDIYLLCLELSDICKKYGVLFILNDRIELGLKLNIDGIHIGIDDESIYFSELRKSFNGIIGVSCYGDINRAILYQNLGANYVAFGSIFKSNTKKNAKIINIDILEKAKNALNIPLCAIGGININNIHHFKKTTLDSNDMIAMISSIWQGDIVLNIERLKNRLMQ